MRAYIGYFLWREKNWPNLRWQSKANFAFLIVIFLATLWHMEAMNWKANIIVAHVWVIAYITEPLILYLIEPRGAEANARLPAELRRGPVLTGLKRVAVFGLVVSVTIGGLAFINPEFLDTRWPWALDPFDARIMAAFLALAALWCVTIYFAEDWVEIRLAELGLAIFAASNFIVCLAMLPQLDPERVNIYAYGIAFLLFAMLLIYYYWKQERAQRTIN